MRSAGASRGTACLLQRREGLGIDRIDDDSAFSEEHEVALSKHLERAILAAASARSALSSMITGTLPAPTPIAGVPHARLAARCLAAGADDQLDRLHQRLGATPSTG